MSLAAALEHPQLDLDLDPGPAPAERPATPPTGRPGRPSRRRAEPLPAVDEPLGALPADEAPVFKALRRDWHARLFPIDAAEWVLADAVACAAWRRRRLDALEDRVLRALLEGAPAAGLPSLAQLCRARARLERDLEAIDRELDRLRRTRPAAWPGLNPDRLDWLAAKLREGRIPPPPEETAEAEETEKAEETAPAGPAHATPEPPAGPAHATPEPAPEAPSRPLGDPLRPARAPGA